jgi:hypothetical protein
MAQPPNTPQKPTFVHSLPDNYNMAYINKCFTSDRAFHAVVSDKSEFSQLLANIGKMPINERGVIAKNMGAVIDLNARLLQDNTIFNAIIQILQNIPESTPEFQELCGKIMAKIREALIKNRSALNLYHKPMADYSVTIRTFLSLIPNKPKTNFLNSFDQQILDFIMGRASDEQKAQKNAERDERIAANKDAFSDDEEDAEEAADKMQRLIKMMFTDVMRLEPKLVSAVILSVVTQLPHGSMIIDDKKLRKELMQNLDI